MSQHRAISKPTEWHLPLNSPTTGTDTAANAEAGSGTTLARSKSFAAPTQKSVASELTTTILTSLS